MLIGLTVQQCDIGCLVCNSSNQCTLCDSSNNYYRNGNTCALSKKPNCLVLGQDGTCVLCNKNYYLDMTTLSCLAIPAVKFIDNCRLYDSNQLCIECTGAFFLADGKCTAVSTVIANCNLYISNGVCVGCSNGYVVSGDFASCVVAPVNLNCLYYTFLSCKKCNKGFINNPNYYFNFLTAHYNDIAYLVYVAKQDFTWFSIINCQEITVQNCAANSAFDICTQCNSGFLLQNGKCVAYQSPPIPGCLVYDSLTNCVECQSGRFLSANTCVANTPILNCANYDGTASSTICTICNTGFYLSGNLCNVRVSSLNMPNCQTVSVSTDTCDACVSNFVLTTDKLACRLGLANCAVYVDSTILTLSLSCSRCIDRYYLSNSGATSNCTPGTVTGCLTYAISTNTCSVCLNGYYLNQGLNTCTKHLDVQNCKTYSQNKAQSCTECNSGFYNFDYSVTCVRISAGITGCATYSQNGFNTVVCATCNPGYFINNNLCSVIPPGNSNCNTFTASGCTACNTGYMLNTAASPNVCVLPLDYINSSTVTSPCSVLRTPATNRGLFWGTSVPQGQTVFGCRICNNLMYGYTPQRDEAICVNVNQLGLYSGFSTVTNCARYGYNYAITKQIVCMECNSGFFINGYKERGPQTTLTSCGTCTNTAAAPSSVIPDDFLGFVNICIDSPANVVNNNYVNVNKDCARLARIKSTMLGAGTGANADYGCVILNQLAVENSKNYFMRTLTASNSATTLFYTLDLPVATTAIIPKDFNNGYSNTVDSNSLVPTVFNYKGLLNDISAVNILNSNILLATGNNLNNCDIIVNYPGGYAFKGYAYVTGTTVKNYAAIPTSNTAAFHSCFRCTFGYQLTYTGTGTTTNNSPFPSCSQMNNCASASIVYGGLSTFLNSVFSCHSCSTTSGAVTFPTIYFETSGGASSAIAAGIWTGWTVSDVYSNAGSININEHGFRCAAAPSAITVPNGNAFTGTSSTFTCAAFGNIQILRAFPPIDTAAVPPALMTCLACPANFFPTYLVDSTPVTTTATGLALTEKVPAFIVKACTASNKCDTTIKTQFNSCAACNAGEVVDSRTTYYAFSDLTLSNCYPSKTQNCFTLDGSPINTGSVNNCGICMAGYFLNTDGVCDQYTVPNQFPGVKFVFAAYTSVLFSEADRFTTFGVEADLIAVKIHYLLSWKQLQYGASSCATGYSRLPTNTQAPSLCVLSSYVANNFASPTGTSFIPNCIKYNLDLTENLLRCGGCSNQFIPLADGTGCISANQFPNCLLVQSTNGVARCSKCAANFLNSDGLCTSAQISNCASYKNTVDFDSRLPTLQCNVCISGFFLSGDFQTCAKGNILNCKAYTNGLPNACTECISGYFLTTLTNGVYCYPIPQTLNCAVLRSIPEETGSTSATISCKTCKASLADLYGAQSWVTSSNTAQTLCMPFNAIPNCEVYDQSNTLFTSNKFTCLKCAAGYWASATTLTCVQRIYTPQQCTEYNPTLDACLKCSAGYFITNNNQECAAYPNGIFACNQYSGINVCTQCNGPYFLSSNTCVASTNTIANCQTYSANSVCSQCSSGFFLASSTSCITPTAVNCLTYSSSTACATCSTGNGLLTTNGVTSCVLITVPNCVTPTTVSPFTCVTCNTGYYPSSAGVCTLVPQTITNCLTYDTATTCTVCTPSAVLNVARTVCNSNDYKGYMDSNCAETSLLASPVCGTCSLGSFFVNGVCTSCTTNNLASGCWSCNPTDNNVCLMCKPTYWMNSKGVCTAVSVTPITPPTNSTVSINKALALSFVAVSLYFDQF